MKNIAFMVLSVAAVFSSGAYAQSSQPAQQEKGGSSQITREQVYQELVAAENDGSLAYLNKTLYAHAK